MGKKIDLNQKPNREPMRKNKMQHPSFSNYIPSNDNQTNPENQEIPSDKSDKLEQAKAIKDVAQGASTGNVLQTIKGAKSLSDSMASEEKIKLLMKNPATRKIIITGALIIIPSVLLIFLIIFIISSITDSSKSNLAMGGYYSMRCQEVTVMFADKTNNYEITDTKTYPLEEYVAGVVAGEVGFFGSLEVDKAFAVAARSYLLTHDDGNCTIESSDRKQVFRELTETSKDQLAIQAAEETAGQVLLLNGELTSSQYDAFACIDKDDNYYTISQANQKIPIEWVESRLTPVNKPSWFICNGKENLQNHHGNGMSQYGSLYLANAYEKTYDEIIDFYLGEIGVSISRETYITSIANLEVKNTTNSVPLNTPLGEFLEENGSSIEELNNFIHENVSENGSGSREGVVTAAVSLVNYLYDNFNIYIPYYWGGNYQKYGVNPQFGSYNLGTPSLYGSIYEYLGFDCSGFVSWAIKNGGYNFNSRLTTEKFKSEFGEYGCDITNKSCIGQPGDLINYNYKENGKSYGHVQLIIAVDTESEKYMIAEATGSSGLIIQERNMHSNFVNKTTTQVLLMDSYYNNENNVDLNY